MSYGRRKAQPSFDEGDGEKIDINPFPFEMGGAFWTMLLVTVVGSAPIILFFGQLLFVQSSIFSVVTAIWAFLPYLAGCFCSLRLVSLGAAGLVGSLVLGALNWAFTYFVYIHEPDPFLSIAMIFGAFVHFGILVAAFVIVMPFINQIKNT